MRGFAHVRILETMYLRAILGSIMGQNRACFWRNTGGAYPSNDPDVVRWQAGWSGARGQLEFNVLPRKTKTNIINDCTCMATACE